MCISESSTPGSLFPAEVVGGGVMTHLSSTTDLSATPSMQTGPDIIRSFEELAHRILLSNEALALHAHVRPRLMQAIAQTGMVPTEWAAVEPARSKWGNTVTFASVASFYVDDAVSNTRYFVMTRFAIEQTRSEVRMSFTVSAMRKNAFTASARITELCENWTRDVPREHVQAEALAALGSGMTLFSTNEQFDKLAQTISTELMP